jgi:hypothetical protein
MLKTLSVGTMPSDEAILDQIEAPGPTLLSASRNRRTTCILEQWYFQSVRI